MEKEKNNTTEDTFPIEVFPDTISKFIQSAHETLGHPKGYLAASVLFTASVFIGKTMGLRVKKGWLELPLLYLMIISEKSTNKSHAMDLPMKPVREHEKRLFRKYRESMKKYNSLSMDEKMVQEVPQCEQALVNDITMEAIAQLLKNNLRGIGYYRDELSAWIKDFNKYRKGSDEQFWLTNYNSGFYRINRVGKPPIVIPKSFISVFGSIQPGILAEIFADDRSFNGFVERILPIFLENVKKPHFVEDELDEEIYNDYTNLMNRILKIEPATDEDNEIVPIEIQFSEDAKKVARDWHNKNVDESNNADNADRAMISKSDMGFYRLCLILQVLASAEKTKRPSAVELDTVNKAIILIEYFKTQGKKIVEYTNIHSVEFEKLTEIQKNVFASLPATFKTGEGLTIAKTIAMPDRTFNDFLKNRKLFIRLKQGYYEKVEVAQPA